MEEKEERRETRLRPFGGDALLVVIFTWTTTLNQEGKPKKQKLKTKERPRKGNRPETISARFQETPLGREEIG